jgi:hypothetical protein
MGQPDEGIEPAQSETGALPEGARIDKKSSTFPTPRVGVPTFRDAPDLNVLHALDEPYLLAIAMHKVALANADRSPEWAILANVLHDGVCEIEARQAPTRREP